MKTDTTIDALAAELTPVRRLRTAEGLALPALATLAAALLVAGVMGLRQDLMDMTPHPMFFLRTGTLALLGVAATLAVVGMARPAVGREASGGWRWALAAAALFPLTGFAMLFIDPPADMEVFAERYGMECLRMSLGFGLAIGATLVLWLRHGAPTHPARAGWMTGLAAGSLGALAYSLHCPFNSIWYVGLWYTVAIALCAVAGRLLVPRLVRW